MLEIIPPPKKKGDILSVQANILSHLLKISIQKTSIKYFYLLLQRGGKTENKAKRHYVHGQLPGRKKKKKIHGLIAFLMLPFLQVSFLRCYLVYVLSWASCLK